jgi:hypothetical protein
MSVTTYNTAGTFTWVCPAGVTAVTVESWGGGGGGGAAGVDHGSAIYGQPVSGGGGGGGGGARTKYSVTTVPGRSYTVTIGAGGAGSADPFMGDSDNDVYEGGNDFAEYGGDTLFVDSTNGQIMAAAEGGGGAETFFGLGGGGGFADYSYDHGVTVYGTLVDSADGEQGVTAYNYLGGDGGSAGGPGGGTGGSGDPSGGFDDWGGDSGGSPGAGGGGATGVMPGDEQYYGPASEGYSTLSGSGGNGAPGKMIITTVASPPPGTSRSNFLMFM